MQMVQVVFLSILVFFVIVTIHEWGHFIFAKRAGILVREFAIGFGPKVFSHTHKETRYTLRLLPVGGFVRMAGEDPEVVDIQPGQTIAVRLKDNQVTKLYLDQLDLRKQVIRGEVESIDIEHQLSVTLDVEGEHVTYPIHPQAMMVVKGQEIQIAPYNRQFGSKSVGKRAMAIFAGPLMNFILAFVLFGVYIQLAGMPVENPSYVKIGEVTDKMPAAKAGLVKGDVINNVNGIAIGGDRERLIKMIENSEGKPMNWSILRDGNPLNVTLTPVSMAGQKGGKVGIAPILPTRTASFGETINYAGNAMVTMTKNIFEGFRQLIFGQFKLDDLGGPVRTFEVTGQFAKQGIDQLTLWTAILSLYLGIFNLLPIPALDGSRLVFLGIESVRGKPIDPNRESMVHFIGFAMLMLLMLAVTYNDILRLVKG
ncbi:RIP metalloprotease RseP [Paenibacillus sp. ACRRX]|uniref:RIP metalloprotease RseP n=1 Tax=unclassified Paenibacillus TaxID=185978 RepID=UPI001EF6F89A|nr:RIP metalloprotease RseP [Paenibacillus sp. UMB4589-SE434]MCG7407457.1 RIP metalloprotease RseP [Paenibacillus sp. ACRRX]MDK8180693.1 RIP metalloprotease RseP [Paenibacillus sp. UMB4589-SE434]